LELGKAFVRIEADQTGLTTGLNKAKTNVSASMKTIGRNMAIAGGVITAAFGMAIKTASQFEQSMANTASVAGATSEELKKLSDYAREMGEQSVFSASEAADAMYYLASAGMNTDEVMGALKGTLDLAAATQSDLAYTSEAVAASLSQFGLDADEAGRVANVFAGTISDSQATMEKLTTSMSYVGPMANSMGMTIEETSGILGKLYDAGLDGSKAGTALRQAFVKLLKPTEDGKAALEKLGVSITDSNGKMRPFVDIMADLEKAGISTTEAIDIFGVRAGPAMMSLVSQGIDSVKDLTTEITGTDKATKMAAMQIDTFQGAMKLLKSAFEELQITLVTDLMPALKGTIEWITEGIKKVTEWMKENPKLTETIVKWTAAIGALMLVLGPLLMILPGLVTGVGLLAGAVTPLTATIGLAIANFIIWFELIKEIDKVLHSHHTSVQDVEDAYTTLSSAQSMAADKMGLTTEEFIKMQAEGKSVSEMMGKELIPAVEETKVAFDDQVQELQEAQKAYDILQDFLEPVRNTITELTKELTPYEQKIADVNEKYDDMIEAIKLFNVSEEEQKEKIDEVNIARALEIAELEAVKAAAEKAAEAKKKLADMTKTLTDKIYEFTHTEEEVKLRDINNEYDLMIENAKEVFTDYNELIKAVEAINGKRQEEIDGLKELGKEKDADIGKNKDLGDSYDDLGKEIDEEIKKYSAFADKIADRRPIEEAGAGFEGFVTHIQHATTALSTFTKEAVAAAITQIKMKFHPIIMGLIDDVNNMTGVWKQMAQYQLAEMRKNMQEQIDLIMYGLDTYNQELNKLGGTTENLAGATSNFGGSMSNSWNKITDAVEETTDAANEATAALSNAINIGSGSGSGGSHGGFAGGGGNIMPNFNGGSAQPPPLFNVPRFATSTPSNQNTTNNNRSYSPSIVVNVSGSGNAADIKRAVEQALNDSARQFNRRGYELIPGMG